MPRVSTNCRSGLLRSTAVLACAVLLTACPKESTADEQARLAAEAAANANAVAPAPAGQTAAAIPPGGLLTAEWYQDSDGNRIPDFVERETGYDPQADDCPVNPACGPGANGSTFKAASNILLILDSSGSMAARLGGQTKLDLAKRALSEFTMGVPAAAKLGFMVYGHKGDNTERGKPASCAGIDLLAPVGGISKQNVPQVLSQFSPRGWTPIADALERAEPAFRGLSGNRIILVSDGLETCGGDPVAVARRLQQSGLSMKVDVVGFNVGSTDAAGLARIAEAGGGTYFNARTYRELNEYLRQQREALNQAMGDRLCELRGVNDVSTCENKMQLAASRVMNARAQSMTDPSQMKARIEIFSLRAKMAAYMSDRRKQRLAPTWQRYDQLDNQVRRNNRQMDDAFGQVRPDRSDNGSRP